MLGMWHTHADGLLRQIVEHPKEFTFVGGYDREADVVAQRASNGARASAARCASSTSPSNCCKSRSTASSSKAGSMTMCAWRGWPRSRQAGVLEKPAGDNLDDFRRLIDQSQRKHLHVQMIYLFRYMSAVQRCCSASGKGS